VVKGYVTEGELQNLYDTCRIMIAPLRYGAGVKGKIVEAMYNGLPVVTTSIGAEGIEQADQLFIIADTAEEYAKAVIDIYSDMDRLVQRSKQYREYIQKNFSTEAVWKKIKEDFE